MPTPVPSTSSSLPLLELFTTWQAYDRKLGHRSLDADTYLTLLHALERGIGVWSRDDLKNLCMTVLIKPHHNEPHEQQFEKFFNQYLKALHQQTAQDAVADPDRANSEGKEATGDPGTTRTPSVTSSPPVPQPESEDDPTPELEKGQTKKGTQITHVAFRHDADLIEGVSTDSASTATEDWSDEANQTMFRLQGTYLPVENRAVQQVLRSIRQLVPQQQQQFTDLPATIKHVARNGYFDRVMTRRLIKAQIPLVLLLDRRGSMVAFHDTIDQWSDAANRQQPPIPVYYFQNCPVNCVFSDPWLTQPVSLTDWKQRHPGAYMLIMSDAGAARGLYSEERLTLTQQFLKDLRPRRVAWLNPMPRQRWWRSTAGFIARRVPMFELDSLEFANAFKYLKGKLSVV